MAQRVITLCVGVSMLMKKPPSQVFCGGGIDVCYQVTAGCRLQQRVFWNVVPFCWFRCC